jgi:hypothetical protein
MRRAREAAGGADVVVWVLDAQAVIQQQGGEGEEGGEDGGQQLQEGQGGQEGEREQGQQAAQQQPACAGLAAAAPSPAESPGGRPAQLQLRPPPNVVLMPAAEVVVAFNKADLLPAAAAQQLVDGGTWGGLLRAGGRAGGPAGPSRAHAISCVTGQGLEGLVATLEEVVSGLLQVTGLCCIAFDTGQVILLWQRALLPVPVRGGSWLQLQGGGGMFVPPLVCTPTLRLRCCGLQGAHDTLPAGEASGSSGGTPLVSRVRHRMLIQESVECLERCLQVGGGGANHDLLRPLKSCLVLPAGCVLPRLCRAWFIAWTPR